MSHTNAYADSAAIDRSAQDSDLSAYRPCKACRSRYDDVQSDQGITPTAGPLALGKSVAKSLGDPHDDRSFRWAHRESARNPARAVPLISFAGRRRIASTMPSSRPDQIEQIAFPTIEDRARLSPRNCGNSMQPAYRDRRRFSSRRARRSASRPRRRETTEARSSPRR